MKKFIIFYNINVLVLLNKMDIAKKVTNELKTFAEAGKLPYAERKISTAIVPASLFYPAQDDHQLYLVKNPWGYCNHGYRFTKWPSA
jgi:peptide methionine sulfoxide reductase MsrA